MRSRGVVVAGCVVLAFAGSAGSTTGFHNTEKHGLGASFHPRGAGGPGGWLSATIVVVKGRPSVKLAWTLHVGRFRGRVLEASLRQGRPGVKASRLVLLCAPCRIDEQGRITVPTRRPWFRRGRTMATIPSLTLELRTTRRPNTPLEAILVKRGFHGYVS